MSADTAATAAHEDLAEEPGGAPRSGRWSALFLSLSLVLIGETFISACFLYDFACDVHTTEESLKQGLYPTDCFYQLADEDELKEVGVASCDLMMKEFQHSVHQRLLLDIQNSLWQTLGEHNVTQIFKPAIHLRAKEELKQYQHQQKTGDPEAAALTLERLNWEALGESSQEGLMGLSPDGEIVVPQDGIYFVYSQVSFETAPSGRDLQVRQHLFKRTALHPEMTMLAKAAATLCLNTESGVDLYSSHQGALFHLEKGDKLSLYVLKVGNVRFPPESTYFGAFMIN